MDYKTLHDKEKAKIIESCLALDKTNKQALCDYLKKTVELMELEIADKVADWSSLEYLEKDSGAEKAFQALCDLTIGWKYDENDIIELDKEIIALLEK